jgi:hypothetical protein
MVGARGFEPRTSCAQGRRATRLRYAPTKYVKIIKDFPTELLLQSDQFRVQLCQNCAKVSFERKADSPNYIKHREVKVGDGAIGVGSCAPEALEPMELVEVMEGTEALM